MIKLLILIIYFWTCDSLNHNILDGLTPNEGFLQKSHKTHIKRDQSKFNDDLCIEQLMEFKTGLDQEEPWALESEIN